MSKRSADEELLQDVAKYARLHEQVMAETGDKTWTIERSRKARLNVLWSALPASDFFFSTTWRSVSWCPLDDIILHVDGISYGSLQNPSIAPLLALSEPAAFGKGGKRVLDTTVRDANAIDAKRINLSADPICCMETGDDDDTRTFKQWCGLPKHCLHLYKLHIYGPGGHFAAHVDTPHGPRHVGSAILQLPTPFTGGKLVVEHMGERREVGPGPAFAAWYTDCQHWVEKVETGHRIVLQYDIIVPDHALMVDGAIALPVPAQNSDAEEASSSMEDEGSVYPYGTLAHVRMTDAQMAEIVGAVGVEQLAGRNVALLLQHRYLSEEGLSVDTLKGMDRVVYNLLSAANVELQLSPLVFITRTGYGHDDPPSLAVSPLFALANDNPTVLYPGIGRKDVDVMQIIEKQQRAESTGNEPLEGHARYLAAAIVALVPAPSSPEKS